MGRSPSSRLKCSRSRIATSTGMSSGNSAVTARSSPNVTTSRSSPRRSHTDEWSGTSPVSFRSRRSDTPGRSADPSPASAWTFPVIAAAFVAFGGNPTIVPTRAGPVGQNQKPIEGVGQRDRWQRLRWAEATSARQRRQRDSELAPERRLSVLDRNSLRRRRRLLAGQRHPNLQHAVGVGGADLVDGDRSTVVPVVGTGRLGGIIHHTVTNSPHRLAGNGP